MFPKVRSPRGKPFGSAELTVEARARAMVCVWWLSPGSGPERNRYVPVPEFLRIAPRLLEDYLLMNSLVCRASGTRSMIPYLVQITVDESQALGWDVLEGDIADRSAGWPQHDPIRLGGLLARHAGK